MQCYRQSRRRIARMDRSSQTGYLLPAFLNAARLVMQLLECRLLQCVCVLLATTSPAAAQEAMPKLIRIVVPFSAGASNDAIARVIAAPLAKRLDATVIVENKPGAAGVIGDHGGVNLARHRLV